MKTAIIVDSTAYLNEQLANHPDVFQVYLTVNFEDDTQTKDTIDREGIQQFYERLADSKQLPTTSQPSPGEYYDVLDEIVEAGYDQVVGIHLDKKISGTYQTAVMISEQYQDKLNISMIDSRGASVVSEHLVSIALILAEKGYTLSEITEKLRWLVKETEIYLIVEDLNNLAKGGRLSATSAILGQLVRVRPILTFAEEGGIILFEKVRTNKKAYQRLSDLVNEANERYPSGVEVQFAYTLPDEGMDEFMSMIHSSTNVQSAYKSLIGPVIGTHLGAGVKAMAIYPKLTDLYK